jgi:hypothetical protein
VVMNVTILNGNITATAQSSCSGIGSAFGGGRCASMIVNLTILNGNITATNSEQGSGIGSGQSSSGGTSHVQQRVWK